MFNFNAWTRVRNNYFTVNNFNINEGGILRNCIIVSKFIGSSITSCIEGQYIYILREVFNSPKGTLAKHLGDLLVKEKITFENDYPISHVMVDIVEAL